jgi:hypothetical protein
MRADADSTLGRIGRTVAATGGAAVKTVEAASSVTRAAVSVTTGALSVIGSVVNGISGAIGFAVSTASDLAGAIGKASAVAGVGVTGLVYAARTYAQSVAEGISGTDDLATSVGMTVEEFSRLQGAVRLLGGDGDKFGEALKSMQRKVIDLAAGNEQAEASFNTLGLSIANFRDKKGNLVSTRQQLDTLIDRIGKVRNPTLQAKAALDIFGKSGKEIGSIFSEGSKGLKESEEEVEKYGTVIKQSSVDTINEALGAQAKLTESLRGLGYTFAKIFFPFFADGAEELSDWLNESQEKIEKFLTNVKDFVSDVKDDLKTLFEDVFFPDEEAAAPAKSAPGQVASQAAADDEEEEEDGADAAEEAADRKVAATEKWIDAEQKATGNYAIINGKRVELARSGIRRAGEGGYKFPIFDSISGPLKKLKDGVLDIFEGLSGNGFGSRVPEIKAFVSVLEAAGNAALVLGKLLLESSGVALDRLPTVKETFDGIKMAIDSFTLGLAGLGTEATMPWAAALGVAAAAAAGGIGTLAQIIVENREAISFFIANTMINLEQALLAIKDLIDGTPIKGENKFAFMNEWIATAENAWQRIKSVFNQLASDVTAAGGKFVSAGKSIYGFLDKLGKFLGLGDGSGGSAANHLIVITAILQLTGALQLLGTLTGIVAAMTFALANLLKIGGTVIGWVVALGVESAAIFGGMAIAWAAFWATFGAIAAASIYQLYLWWDDMVAGLKALWDLLLAYLQFDDMVEGAKAVWGLLVALVNAGVDDIKAAWNAITGFFADLWAGISSGASRAWDGMKAVWGGLVDFFMNPVAKVKQFFVDLWASIKGGAADAWGYVKSAFGFGAKAPAGGQGGGVENLESFDVGGIIPGNLGAPRKILAHGGERVLTTQETPILDRLLGGLAALSSMDFSTPYSAAPVAVPAGGRGMSGLSAYGLDVMPGDRAVLATQAGIANVRRALEAAGMRVRTPKARRS